jgi:hypothetical protein
MSFNCNVTLEDVSEIKTAEDHYKLCDVGGQEWASFRPSRKKIGDACLLAPPAVRIWMGKDEEIQFEMMLVKKYGAEPLDDSPAYIRGAVVKPEEGGSR